MRPIQGLMFRRIALQASPTRNLRRPFTNTLCQALRRLTIKRDRRNNILGRTFHSTTLLSRPNHNRWRPFRRLRRREGTPPPQACLPT